ncbi:MAG: PIG-L family deacetylase, partial [Actinomycetes bacterium]
HWVDVTAHLDTKFAALDAHASQTAHMEDMRGMITQWMTLGAETARASGMDLPADAAVEAFRIVSTG